MSPPRTLVTGGTGYAGRFIVELLLEAGHAVTLWSRHLPPPEAFSAPFGFVQGDLDPYADFGAALGGADFLVHAAFAHVPGRYRGGEGDDPAGFRRQNFKGSMALFEAARAAGVRRAVFLSSRAVYGVQAPGVALTEATEPHPDTLYGAVKLETERALAGLRTADFEPASLRVTGIYGPAGSGQRHKWADLFDDFLAGQAIQPRVATEVHGADVAEAVRLSLEKPELPHDLLNVSDVLLDRHDLLSIVRDVTGSRRPLPPKADASALNVMDTSRIAALGWRGGGWPLLERTVRSLLTPRKSR